MNLAAMDLNRLLVLHAVLEERSVTRAAARLHVTPSAVSNALAQLRASFGDPLVVRAGRGLALTPRAAALAPRLADAVASVARVVEEQAGFDPARSARSFALATSDAEQIGSVPRVVAAFAAKLPRAQLRVLSVDQLEAAGGLASGEVDAAIAPAYPPPEGYYARDLYDEEGVLVVRRDHPRAGARISREVFNALRHVDILLALGRGGIGHDIVEEFFAAHGLRRDVAVTVPSFAAAAAIAAQTDLVVGMPRRLAELFAQQMPLRIATVPAAPPLRFRIQLHWHARTHADPGARFFRDVVLAALGPPRAAGRARR